MHAQDNRPELWQDFLPRPAANANKYDRGHALILAAPELTGATRLAATACSRMGAGLVTVISSQKSDFFRMVLPPDIMVREAYSPAIRGITAILAGPGGSVLTDETLPEKAFRILDAGALPQAGRYDGLDARSVLTPHDGEFGRSFPELSGSRPERTLGAAKASGAVIVLKGAETIIASPEGTCITNRHASPWLAKAGTGDVLAGMITGLLAQCGAGNDAENDAGHSERMFRLVCAAVWMHGEAGRRIGPGLTASDMESVLPSILRELLGD